KGEVTLSEVIRPTTFDRVHLVPSTPQMHHLLTNGFARPEAELQFIRDIHQIAAQTKLDEHGTMQPRYDWIILDTPPAQTFAARASLAAADHILIPAFAEEFAMQGINGFLSTTKTMRSLMTRVEGWHHAVLGILIARWHESAIAKEHKATLVNQLTAQQFRVFGTAIPLDDRINKAHHATVAGGWRNLFNIGNGAGPAAQAYRACVKEMLQYVRNSQA
ncbi:MAG: ParA family protein, partial [Ktedonobacterales bacterium]